MSAIFLAVVVLFPIVGGVLIPLLPFRSRAQMMVYTESVVLLNAILAIALLLNRPAGEFVLLRFTSNLTLSFRVDGLGTVFAGLISVLWPLATLYAFEYMKHEEHEKFFFMFYTITFGITMGIALAEDVVTMYCFYEMLTLVTLPLVIHTLTREAVLAGRTYLYYSLGGAAFAFIGVIFILIYGSSPNFAAGGVLDLEKIGDRTNLLLLIYVLCFFGFSVKAAMFPFSGWLPKAGVAPTPVTALLHAVAVVKAGAFTTMRITYYCFGTDFLRGTWAQTAILIPIIFTIVYGCSRALKETHMKRRLAWSTVSNLSYILFGTALMTPLGLVGAICHMICHAVIKICSFFCAGAVICQSGREYIHQLDGLGRKMPKTFVIFTISGLALMGVPGLAGFISKWNLVKAALDSTHPLAVVGVAALMISALLTAIYMITISVRAFCSPAPREASSNEQGVLPPSEARGRYLSSPAPREASSNEQGVLPPSEARGRYLSSPAPREASSNEQGVLPPSEARGRYLSSPAPRGAKIPFSAGSMGTLVASARTIEGASDSDRKSNIKSNGQTLSGQQSASTAWAMPSETKKAPEHKVVPYDEVRDPGWMMLLPLVLFVAAMLVIGLHPEPLIDAFTQIASALG